MPSSLWPVNCSAPGFPVLYRLSEISQTHVHWVTDAVWPSHPLSFSSPLALRRAQHQSLLQKELAFWIRWPKYGSFRFRASPFSECSGLTSFGMDWLDLLAVQGTLQSLLQHRSLKASVLWCSAFFMVQLSHPYMTAGKTIALTRRTFVGKVMFLLFNTLLRFVIALLIRSKCLDFVATVTVCSDFGAQENEIWHCFHIFSICLPRSDRTGCHYLCFLNIEF